MTKLDQRVRQNSTTGKSPKACQALFKKIFRYACRANQWLKSARLTANEGRSRSSRPCGEMRWTRKLRLTSGAYRVRQNRVVLTPRRWCQVRGKQTLLAGDGGKKARSPRRERYKP